MTLLHEMQCLDKAIIQDTHELKFEKRLAQMRESGTSLFINHNSANLRSHKDNYKRLSKNSICFLPLSLLHHSDKCFINTLGQAFSFQRENKKLISKVTHWAKHPNDPENQKFFLEFHQKKLKRKWQPQQLISHFLVEMRRPSPVC